MIIWMLLGVLAVFIIVVLIRAAMFQPKDVKIPSDEMVTIDEEKVVKDMQELIRCKTISYNEEEKVDKAEFEKFKNLLPQLYPTIHAVCERKFLGVNGILYRWPGKSCDEPIILMSHYDVVPVEEDQWEKPAFDAILEDGILWGRGTLDTKGTLCGIMEAAEQLMKEAFVPAHDIYFAFSGQEEINGTTCPDMVSWFEQQGIRPGMVLDEGGAVVENIFPGVTKECAVIGIAEKGMLNIELHAKSKGGHASTPPKHTIVGELAQAIVKIENHPFPHQFTKPVLAMLDTLGRHSSFLYKILFANMWCFKGLFALVCKLSGGELNAMVRTTCAMTKMEGSKAFNVIPPVASAGMNLRLIGTDTIDSAKAYIEHVIQNPEIEVSVYEGRNPSINSDISCEAWDILCQAVTDTWQESIVSPYLMMACSDSWYYNRISDKVYKFSAMKLSKEERGMIHGNNERVPVETLVKTVEFYQKLMKKL